MRTETFWRATPLQSPCTSGNKKPETCARCCPLGACLALSFAETMCAPVAFAFTQPGWMDVAAFLCCKLRTEQCSDVEPVTHIAPLINRRSFMHLVWTNVAYFFWCNGDRVRLRALLETGVITSTIVADMLLCASMEIPGLPQTKRVAHKAEKTQPFGDDDDCAVRRAMIRDLIVATDFMFLADDPTSAEAVATCAYATEHCNLSMLRFVFTEMYGTCWFPSAFVHEWIWQCTYRRALFDAGHLYMGCIPLHNIGQLAKILTTVFVDLSRWHELSYTHIYAPGGILATVARELHMVELASFWFIDHADAAFPLQLADVGRDIMKVQCIGVCSALAYVLSYCVLTHITELQRNPNVVFDYDFRVWDRAPLLACEGTLSARSLAARKTCGRENGTVSM